MSFVSKVAIFALRELAKPALAKCGEHLGDAAGKVLGRKIDPKPPEDSKEKKEKKDDDVGG